MAHQEAPTLWGDDDDLVVTRESLDGTQSDADSFAASSQHGDDGDAQRAETGDDIGAPQAAPSSTPLARIAWDRRLTLRQRLLRGGGSLLLVTLTLYLLLGGPRATVGAIHQTGDAINARLHPPKPQPTLAERGFTFIKSPPGSYNVQGMSIAPVMGQASAAWTCWLTPSAPSASNGPWNAHAFYTPDGGARWTALTLPQSTGFDCTVSADSERPSSALVTLPQGAAPDGSCIAPFMYLTTDTGATWERVPWPLGPSDGACQYQVALEGGAVYISSTTPIVRGVNPYIAPTGRFIVSRDAGQTWTLADYGLDDSNGLDLIGFRPGGRILADIPDVRGNGATAMLVTSDDYGASWRGLGDIIGAFPTVYASSDINVTDHGGWGRLYALTRAEDSNGSPSVPAQYELATMYIGQQWTTFPLPPLPHGANAALDSNSPLAVGVGPAGSLEVERGVVEAANAQLSPSRRLWVWNPTQREWLLDPQPMPGDLDLQGASWRAGAQTFWMTTLQLGVPPVLEIYTKVYPADLLTHIQSGGS